jgi:4-hydroxybenzoate polyprenyltransferase
MSYERYSQPVPEQGPKTWRTQWPHWWQLVRGDRQVGTLLLLWPTWWALWLAAGGVPPLGTLLIFTAGVWLTRSAGCIINDYNDRWLDPHVERTKNRPLATGAVSPREALALFAALMLVAFGLVLLTNWLTVALSVAAVFLAATYPLLKRYTYLPQVYLGIAFGWGIPMAFAAVQGTVPPLAWLLFLGNLLWTTGYDTWYAMVDRDDDLRVGARSTAILFGDADLGALAVIYAGFFWAMWLVGARAELGLHYQAGLGAALLCVLLQFWIARGRGRAECFTAFRANQWVGLAVFAGIAAHYALPR